MAISRLIHPLRVVRARSRWLNELARHRAEVRAGRQIEARADRVPIFIVGAPRSGTTLLYQLLVEGLDVGWIANAHMSSPGSISLIERRDRPRAGRRPTSWTSRYGATQEPWEPNEGGEFWYRFVPRTPHELDDAIVTDRMVRTVRAAVRLFAAACARPLVFKNVYCSLRVPLLARALPEARFVLIERDVESTARSILVGRERHGGVGRWISARPAGADELGDMTPAAQAVWQVRRMDAVARRELERLASDRWLCVDYDRLCADPSGALRAIHQWLLAGGAQVDIRREAQLPASFERRAGGRLAPELEASLEAALAAPLDETEEAS